MKIVSNEYGLMNLFQEGKYEIIFDFFFFWIFVVNVYKWIAF